MSSSNPTLSSAEHRYFLDAPASILNNPSIRIPQQESYRLFRQRAVESINLPAILELPTACGKTGVICLAPFGVAQGRVLVIAPNVTIRQEIVAKFDASNPSNIYRTLNFLPASYPLPQVIELSRDGAPNLDDCQRADVIVANIQQALIYREHFPPWFFDLLIVDEGHHIPASSWQHILTRFRHAKKLYLTATPFRADGQAIDGHPMYRYRLADAIANRYVKNLVRVDAVPSRLVFMSGDARTEYRMADVMRLKSEDWFSRGIALSPACNETILEKAVQLLHQKRSRSRFPHQIIAAACSQDHARQLVTLCQRMGLRTTTLLSSMPQPEQDAIKAAIKKNQYDCIVHVGMLGEGYDHPPFSIAAIFRPYRSRAPYEQFIGRTLRYIQHGTAEDNIAHIVSHIGLDLDRLWNDFRNEVRDPLSYQAAEDPLRPESEIVIHVEEREATIEGNNLSPHASLEDVSEFAVDAFIPIPTLEPSGLVAPQPAPFVDPLAITPLQTVTSIPDAPPDQPTAPVATAPVNRPDKIRKELKKTLSVVTRKLAGRLMATVDAPPTLNIIPILGKGDEKNTFEVYIRLLQRELNKAMGKDESHSDRDSWSFDELQAAQRAAERLVPALAQRCSILVAQALRDQDT